MLKSVLILAASVALIVQPASAVEYDCTNKETAVKLNDHDIKNKNREDAIAEMKSEIKDGGGSTDQQKKALEALEQKLAAAKADREKLLADCNTH